MKKILKLCLIIFTFLILLNRAFAYDINNPKPVSERSYTSGNYVTLLDGSTWYVWDDCPSSQSGIILFASDNIENSISWDTVINDRISRYKSTLGSSLSNAGGNSDNLAVDILGLAAVLSKTGGLTTFSTPSWLTNSNFWLKDISTAPKVYVVWSQNNGTAVISDWDYTETLYWGFRPYISLYKSNIRGKYSVSTSTTSNGSVSALTSTNNEYYDLDEKITVTVIPNTGYKLKSNSLKYNETTVIGKDSSSNYAYLGPNSNTNVSAEFEPIDYSIIYHNVDGLENYNPTSYNIETSTITLTSLSKKNYSFEGWYSDEQFENLVTQIPKGSTGNINLFAKWEMSAPSYEISIPSTIIANKNTGNFDIIAGNFENVEGSVEVSLIYPNGGFKLKHSSNDEREFHLYKGSSSIEANEITNLNLVAANFSSEGTQGMYYTIGDGKYAGLYNGTLTFNIDYIDS
ncbi:MAG: InlB B-repeat-containing protein [bacterium]|nr:InlB B-repeat-containing protein [bacterium]